jgi:hypothetical protein
MDDKKLAELLQGFVEGAIQGSRDMAEDAAVQLNEQFTEYAEVVSFEAGGYLTNDPGFVLRVGDDEFQVTVIRRA